MVVGAIRRVPSVGCLYLFKEEQVEEEEEEEEEVIGHEHWPTLAS